MTALIPGETGELADYSFDGIVVCDGQGVILYWNPAAQDLYGRAAPSVLGRNISELAADRAAHERDWARLRHDGTWSGEIARVMASGAPVAAVARRMVRRRDDGAVHEVVEISRRPESFEQDIVGELRASAERNSQLIRHMPAALWQVDARGSGVEFARLRAMGITDIAAYLAEHPELVEYAKDVVTVRDANLAAAEIFRARDVTELLRPVRYLFAASPQMAANVMISKFTGLRNYKEEAQILTFDGHIRDVMFSVTYPVVGELQDSTFILIEDITERRRTERQLRKLETNYSHAARISTLGELATSIAHEVKQPLAAIITNAEASQRWLAKDELNVEKLTQLTGRIAESAHRANDIIQRIRSMATKHEPARALIDLAEVIAEALLFVRHDIETRSVELTTNIPRDLPCISGDRVLLQQVFVNLLVNAIQAVVPREPGQRRIALQIARMEDEWLAVSVRDTGPGIPPDVLPRLFDGFFTTKEGGMGMGLAICQSLVDSHDGFISAANRPEGGAVFEVRLPIAAISDEDRSAA